MSPKGELGMRKKKHTTNQAMLTETLLSNDGFYLPLECGNTGTAVSLGESC